VTESHDDRDAAGESEAAEGGDESGGDLVVLIGGYEIVIEEAFVEFPWRAGIKRGPIAFGVVFVCVALLAALGGGFGGGTVAGTVAYLLLVIYGLHLIPVVRGSTPEFLQPVAEWLIDIPYLRGFVLYGSDHGRPIRHVSDILAGKTRDIGHINPLPASPNIPIEVYAAVPALVLVAVGAEFALRYWDDVIVDSPIEVPRFGAAVGVGYLLVLFVGSFFVSEVGALGVAVPDRYLTVVFGFVYPAVFATIGATLVYVQQEYLAADAPEESQA